MQLHRPRAFAGFLVVGLLALVGFAAFSATGARAGPPLDLPDDLSARVAGVVLAIDLDEDPAPLSLAPEPTETATEDAPPTPPAAAPTTVAPTTRTPATSAAPTTAAPATRPPATTAAPTTAAPTTQPPTTSTAPTTAAPTTTATSYPPGVVGGTRDVEEWRPLVEQYFPAERVAEALAVIECESRGDPLAQHPVTLASGLFQFIPNTWDWASERAGWGGHSPFEPEANVASAAWLVQITIEVEHPRGPWAHWSCQPPPG